MAPEVAEVIWYNEDSVSPLTVAKPAAFASRDLLIAVIVQHNNPSNQSDLSVSADWVLEGNYDGVTSDAKVFSHIYDPADPSTWSFVYRATADVCLGLFRITGADQAPVITVTSTAFASTTSSMDSPDLGPAGAVDLLISVICDHGNGGAFTVTDPAGMTDLGQVQVANLYMAMAAAHEALVSSANPGVRTWTNVSRTGTTGGTISITVKSPASADPLDPIVNIGPPWWIARQIAMAQTRLRPQDDPPGPGIETGRTLLAPITTSVAVKVASCTGRVGFALSSAGTETRTDVYVAETFSSTQSDGLGDGSAITTARTYAGDWLIVAVTDSQSGTPPTKPGGWSDIALPDNVSGTNFEVFLYALLNPAAQTTYTWTVTGGRRTIEGALVRGASTTTLLDEADSLETATLTSHASPSVLTLGTNRAILAYNVLRGFPTSTWSQTSGWLEYLEAVGGDGTTNMQVSLQARTAPTATTYSDTFVCSVAEPAIVVLLAVIPLVGGGAGATAENGTSRVALTSTGAARKTSINVGAGQLALTTVGTARKVASQTGAARVGITGVSTATKKALLVGATSVAVTDVGVARKIALQVGTSTLAATNIGVATKKASLVGATRVALLATGLETTASARAQIGACAVAFGASSSTRKTVLPAGSARVAVTSTSVATKKVLVVGQANLAVTVAGLETSGVSRQQTGAATVASRATGVATKKALPVGIAYVALRTTGTSAKKALPVGATYAAVTTIGTVRKLALAQGSTRAGIVTAGVAARRIAVTGKTTFAVIVSGVVFTPLPADTPIDVVIRTGVRITHVTTGSASLTVRTGAVVVVRTLPVDTLTIRTGV